MGLGGLHRALGNPNDAFEAGASHLAVLSSFILLILILGIPSSLHFSHLICDLTSRRQPFGSSDFEAFLFRFWTEVLFQDINFQDLEKLFQVYFLVRFEIQKLFQDVDFHQVVFFVQKWSVLCFGFYFRYDLLCFMLLFWFQKLFLIRFLVAFWIWIDLFW